MPCSEKSLGFLNDDEMLESLIGLSIKGFVDCNEPSPNTPSSTNASLPTPPTMKSSHAFFLSTQRALPSYWFIEDKIAYPNAPQLKDADSFTEGTGQGSFDFPLGPSAGEIPEPLIYHPEEDIVLPTPFTVNSLALDLLPCSSNPTDVVLAWMDGVPSSFEGSNECLNASFPQPDPPPKKRRRSFFDDDDDEGEERPSRRVWSPTPYTSFIPYPRRQDELSEDTFERDEPEAPG